MNNLGHGYLFKDFHSFSCFVFYSCKFPIRKDLYIKIYIFFAFLAEFQTSLLSLLSLFGAACGNWTNFLSKTFTLGNLLSCCHSYIGSYLVIFNTSGLVHYLTPY